jgi:hypothetical protein
MCFSDAGFSNSTSIFQCLAVGYKFFNHCLEYSLCSISSKIRHILPAGKEWFFGLQISVRVPLEISICKLIGYNCDRANHKEQMEGLVSSSNTIFNLENDGQQSYKIKEIVMYGAIVTQMFETEGVSHLSVTNVTHTLVNDGPAGSAISVGGSTYTSLAYAFADGNLQWDSNRNLKAKEPFFSSGQYMTDLAGNTAQTVF